MDIQGPRITETLNKWREKNNLTTPEWDMFARAWLKRTIIFCIAFFLLGITYGYWIIPR